MEGQRFLTGERLGKTRAAAALAAALSFITAAVTGCGRGGSSPVVSVAPGVTFVRDDKAGVQLLDIDLATASVRPVIAAANIERRRGNVIGDAKTVEEWAKEHRGVIGGINGGFFGDTYDDLGRRKQIVNLCLINGKVQSPGAFAVPARTSIRILRSAIGFTESGMPDIAWATATYAGTLRRYNEPVNPDSGTPWRVHSALACGPRLYVRGRRRITDREERLVSPGRLMRAFVAYDHGEDGKPRHLVFARADAMEYTHIADYLAAYFQKTHGTSPHDAMCLDGGHSAQLVYRDKDGNIEDAEPTGVLVPTAILLAPK